MTDDLVEQMKGRAKFCRDRGEIKTPELIEQGFARIEALTAERDAAYANGYRDAETEISKSALGQRNYFLHSQYANAADRIEQLTAERDRLRKVLKGLMAHEPDYSDTLWQDARAALKGESHE